MSGYHDGRPPSVWHSEKGRAGGRLPLHSNVGSSAPRRKARRSESWSQGRRADSPCRGGRDVQLPLARWRGTAMRGMQWYMQPSATICWCATVRNGAQRCATVDNGVQRGAAVCNGVQRYATVCNARSHIGILSLSQLASFGSQAQGALSLWPIIILMSTTSQDTWNEAKMPRIGTGSKCQPHFYTRVWRACDVGLPCSMGTVTPTHTSAIERLGVAAK